MNVLLVDPSLFTEAYDAALMRGLSANGVQPMLVTRPARSGQRPQVAAHSCAAFFYRRIDRVDWLPGPLRLALKGCAHVAGMARLVWKVRREKPDAVHFQWVVVPLVDVVAMAIMRRWCPLVLTVHDTVPHNGEKLGWPQQLGHRLAMSLAERVIVHTRSGRQTLVRQGVREERIAVISHGPLALPACVAPAAERDPRWTVVLFGEVKPYKGLDVLIEAVAALPLPVRQRLRVVVAGKPRMDLAPLTARIGALGLAVQFDLRLKHLTEEEMAALFGEADSFVFPYRQIDASGVYYLVKSLGKWLIASRVGVFAEEDLAGEGRGVLVPPQDVRALAEALQHAVETRPCGQAAAPRQSWSDIGQATRALYERARREFDARPPARTRRAWQR